MSRTSLLGVCAMFLVAVISSVGHAQPEHCYDTCMGINAQALIASSRLKDGSIVNVNYSSSWPTWWDGAWVTNHLDPACSAWEAAGNMAFTITSFDQDIKVNIIGTTQEWISRVGEGRALDIAVTESPGAAWETATDVKNIYINAAFYSDELWHEESGTGTFPQQIDLQTVLVHEIGHAMGFGHILDGYEYCTVMTYNYSEVAQSIGPLDGYATLCYYPDVAVSDIQSFDASSAGHNVALKFKVQELQNSPYAAVYVSDNALGPALLVDSLTAHPAALPDSNQWTDSLRLPPAGNYYYWLDYDTGPFAAKRSPVGLFPGDSNPASITGTSAVHFSPPSIFSIADVPLDRGGSLTVNWSAPNGYEDADAFNIYRHSYPGGSPGTGSWQVIGWTGTSTFSYVDHGAATGWANDYKVSIAHHGNFVGELQPGDGNVGIWNDFSSVVSASPIDNFGLSAIALLSGDTLRVCPEGDDGSLQVEETIWGNAGGPTVGVPADMLICYMQGDSAQICGGDTLIADGPTDQYGKTTFTTPAIGGHGRADVIVGLADGFTRLDTVTVYFKSPDENGDGVVDLSDLSAWAVSYRSPPATYPWYRDFNGNGSIDFGDYSYIASHYDDACSGGGTYVAERNASAGAANIALAFSQVRSAETASFYVDVTVTGQPRFSVMFVSLRSDNPSLEFKNWQPGSFSGRVLAAPVSRKGVNEIAVCALDGGKLVGSSLDLGRLTYAIKTAGDVVLSPSDFEVRVADVMTVAGPARIGRSTSSDRDVRRVFLNELAQNYPNPFNPATTIAFSIEKAAHVDLSIYDVRGARVRTLVDQHRNAGAYHVDWDGHTDRGQQVASGVYFYKLVAGSFTDTKKMTILK